LTGVQATYTQYRLIAIDESTTPETQSASTDVDRTGGTGGGVPVDVGRGVLVLGHTITLPGTTYWQIQDAVTFTTIWQGNAPHSETVTVNKVTIIDLSVSPAVRIENVNLPQG
jgi:hypothetical protein